MFQEKFPETQCEARQNMRSTRAREQEKLSKSFLDYSQKSEKRNLRENHGKMMKIKINTEDMDCSE